MKNNKKRKYVAPQLEVIEMDIEQGFAQSYPYGNGWDN